jgi:2-keto-myo-inositol isomerase
MRDPHRVMVGRDDLIDNIGQIRALIDGGYSGLFSFEPFAESVALLSDARPALEASMTLIKSEVAAKAA